MTEIRDVDLAWEAFNTLRILSCQMLAAVEQMGGGDRGDRLTEAAALRQRELRARCNEYIKFVLAKMPPEPAITSDLTLATLIEEYKQTARYRKLIYKSRCSYDANMKRIERDYGKVVLKNVTSEDLEKWRAHWSGGGAHPAMGHAVMTATRILLRFGVRKFGDENCARLAVHFPRFEKRKTGTRKHISAAQLVQFRAQAHKMGLHSLALAGALLFEAELGQKQLVGCWVPLSEPGSSNIIHKEKKWLGEVDWSRIDSDRILRLPAGAGEIEI
jgi:hypothetical protein